LIAKVLRSLGKPKEFMMKILAEIGLAIVRIGMLYYLFKRIANNSAIPGRIVSVNWLVLIMYKTTKNF
jgi:hypothetical protein